MGTSFLLASPERLPSAGQNALHRRSPSNPARLTPDLTGIKGRILGHFGTADALITLKDAKALEAELRAAGVDVIFDKYTGSGHAFFNDTDRLGNYDAQAAQRSWERTVGFLHAELATPAPGP